MSSNLPSPLAPGRFVGDAVQFHSLFNRLFQRQIQKSARPAFSGLSGRGGTLRKAFLTRSNGSAGAGWNAGSKAVDTAAQQDALLHMADSISPDYSISNGRRHESRNAGNESAQALGNVVAE